MLPLLPGVMALPGFIPGDKLVYDADDLVWI